MKKYLNIKSGIATIEIKLALLFLLLNVFTLPSYAQKAPFFVLDMVHHNPGEPLTQTSFTNPQKLRSYGYNGQVINDFVFAHAALTFDKLDKRIFPEGSKEREWVKQAAEKVRSNIRLAKQAGLKVYYFTDIVVLPKKLVELYRDEICDEQGRITFDKPKTLEIHRLMFDELFETFPDLDGLIIRTGETYLNNVPYHTGGDPITHQEESHIKIIKFLREEVAVKHNKMVFYRTWHPRGLFHVDPAYYLKVTNAIEPHPNLVFSVKHTKGDYHRTYAFNPTIMIGKHPQIIEVQCQREYEGKGAFPNYLMNGVINGFEEYKTNTIQPGNQSLDDIKDNPLFRGVWSWSRGGGWVGPYITNELWCDINAYVISQWASDRTKTELDCFNQYLDHIGITDKASRDKMRQLCLLSAKAVIRGHSSVKYPVNSNWVWWMRDQFLSGIDQIAESKSPSSEGILYKMFTNYYERGLLRNSIKEKEEAHALFGDIVKLSKSIDIPDEKTSNYLNVSSRYGYILHGIIAEGWKIMALGFIGDKTGNYELREMKKAIEKYDQYWGQFKQLKNTEAQSATLYEPYAFVYKAPDYHLKQGMGASVDKYRAIVNKKFKSQSK